MMSRGLAFALVSAVVVGTIVVGRSLYAVPSGATGVFGAGISANRDGVALDATPPSTSNVLGTGGADIARLTGGLADYGVDDDNDSLYERLAVDVGVLVTETVEYGVEVTLLDSDGASFAHGLNRGVLTTGVITVSECELIDRQSFPSQSAARMAVFGFIEGWYNPHRRHSGLDYLSPLDFERRHLYVQLAA